MCQLFASISKQKHRLNDVLRSFYANSDRHPHGWGLALVDDENVTLEKEPLRATDSVYLRHRLSSPIEAATAFAHIRYATVGTMDHRNCHPFTLKDKSGRTWLQNHNGTIFSAPALAPYVHRQTGGTDSERILLYVVDEINRAEEKGSLSAAERFALVERLLAGITEGNKVNYMLFDGEIFYVHKNCEHTLFRLRVDDGWLFATEPLDTRAWEELPMNTLLGYRNAELVFTGTPHGHTYVEDPEKLRYAYLAYAEL